MKKIYLSIVVGLCLAFLAPATLRAEIYDSSRKWMTITTPNFFVRYAEESEVVARKTAVILEEAYKDLTVRYNWKPWGRTEVVLVDSADIANGLSAVIPYNWMVLYASPPLPDQTMGYYNDWLRLLVYHELEHTFHLDPARGWWKIFRGVLGKTAAPAGLVPVWVKEGEAVYIESAATGTGRAKSSFTDMVIRSAALEGRFPTIAMGDGFQWEWPSYNIPYLFGGEFIQWLVDKYGPEKLQAFNDRTQRTMMLSMVNYAARTVYDKTLVQLWKEWQGEIIEKFAVQERDLASRGLTHTDSLISINPKWEEYVSSPVVSMDGKNIAYSVTSPHHSSDIRIYDVETGKSRTVVKKQEAIQISWYPDGSSFVYSALGTAKKGLKPMYDYPPPSEGAFERGNPRDNYYDLWRYEVETGELKRLTEGARARDPDVSRDGKRIVYVARDDRVTDSLNIMDVETGTPRTIVPAEPFGARVANPRFSPDGRTIAVTMWDPKNMWKIYRCSLDGKCARLTKASKGMELTPWWTPDGKYVLYSSDESGIANIYRVEVSSGRKDQLTNVMSGAFKPTTSDGRRIEIQYYTSRGFELHAFDVSPAAQTKEDKKSGKQGVGAEKSGSKKEEQKSSQFKISGSPQGYGSVPSVGGDRPELGAFQSSSGALSMTTADGTVVSESDLSTKKYAPWGKSLFLPRFVIPAVAYQQDHFYFSLLTGGSDVLRWHNWLAGVTYMTGANYAGYFARYWYNRFKPIFGAGIIDYAVDYGNRTFLLDDDADPTTPPISDTRRYYEKRRNVYGFVAYPYDRHVFSLSYSFEDRMPHSALLDWERQALTLGRFGGFTFAYGYNDAENHQASISPENGRQIKLQSTWYDTKFGSSYGNRQVIFIGDWREYVRLWRHQVLALRLTGGMTWLDTLTQGTFVVGGAWGEGMLARQSSLAYFPLRGLPNSAFGATRAILMSAEYRFPIISPQRGLGTWPLYVKEIHGALFADYGDGWVADSKPDNIGDFFDKFMLGIGAEVRGDFIIGHGLPVKGRLGYGIIVVNRDRVTSFKDPILKTDAKYGVLILELGTSF